MTTLVAEVFKTVGQPTITYVEREDGKLDQSLNAALNEPGQLCLITGPSKTGKTTLYRKVLSGRNEIPLIVRCDKGLTVAALWRQALEAVDFERAETRTDTTASKRSGELEAQGTLGWHWLAGATAKLKGSVAAESSEQEVRKKVLAEPGPDLLVPILQSTNYVLIIEDFHYLAESEKILLFQQWKRFIDSEVSVLVLGTTHRAVDIANSNKDLIGRIKQIDVVQWSQADLEKICKTGFDFLKVSIPHSLISAIANEAVGLPILVQQSCLQMLEDKRLNRVRDARGRNLTLKLTDVETALHHVATTKYTQFRSYYDTLIKGPREKTRKYRTYELIIGCFTLDPIKFSLSRHEIDQRIEKLCPSSEIPPAASMNSTFGALKKFQERRNFELLEWLPNEEVLYIIEPSFLFYVRWRRIKSPTPVQLDFLEMLVSTEWKRLGESLSKIEGNHRKSFLSWLSNKAGSGDQSA